MNKDAQLLKDWRDAFNNAEENLENSERTLKKADLFHGEKGLQREIGVSGEEKIPFLGRGVSCSEVEKHLHKAACKLLGSLFPIPPSLLLHYAF